MDIDRAEAESEAKWADEYFRNWQNANKTATRLRGLLVEMNLHAHHFGHCKKRKHKDATACICGLDRLRSELAAEVGDAQ